MIGKLKGIFDDTGQDFAIIDVGGVGYKVYCSTKSLSSFANGQEVELYIETHVREDHIHLYGFVTSEEQATFNLLQSVKGVGTRMALAILSTMSPQEIQIALSAQDKAAFNQVSGVGRKLAERIITELKDKYISDVNFSSNNITSSPNAASGVMGDAVEALVSLGIAKSDAYSKVAGIMTKSPDLDINDVIKLALQNQI